MKKLVITALAAMATFVLGAAETVKFGNWSVLPVKAKEGADIKKCLPEEGEWKAGGLGGKIALAAGAKGGNLIDGDFNAWYKTTFDVPAGWKGKSVRWTQQLNFCALVIFVNGKEAGVAHFPDGDVELAPFLKYGAPNEIKVFATNRGYGTGEGPIMYRGRGDWGRGFNSQAHFQDAPALVVRTPVYVDDVYANASWRGTQDKDGKWDGKKKVTVDVEINAIDSGKAEIAIDIANENGPSAVSKTEKVKVQKGFQIVKVEIPFPNAEPWETVPNPKLYTVSTKVTFDGQVCDNRREKFLFGFREIWTEGKEFYMNGHIQRFRGYWPQGDPKVLSDLHKYGYNVAYETHYHWAIQEVSQQAYENKSRSGICVFAGMPTIVYARVAVREDPSMSAQWHRCLKHWMRTFRNWPCAIAASCGVNQICPERNMRPDILAQDRETNGVAQNIEYARDEAKKIHPNALYFSHADGTEADVSSSNLYFNFTPLQEREEWLSQWAEKGILPWYAAEFGAPYYACWFHSRVPQMTEWLATYYGEKAYESELDGMLEKSPEFAKCCLRMTHGGWVKEGDLYVFNPLGETYSSMLVYRTNRAWRYFGMNGGLMYLTSWPWDKPNAMRDRQMQANGTICTFLGGDPEITDRTHAYWEGAEIKKSLVFIWDGVGENKLTANWKLVDRGGKKVADGTVSKKLKTGEIVKETISVKSLKPGSYRFEVAFSADREMDLPANQTVKSDAFDIEVYSAKLPKVKGKAAIFDPDGFTKADLAALGVELEDVASLDEGVKALAAGKGAKYFIVGRRALTKGQGLEKLADAIAKGLKVIVFNQAADVWQTLGFQVEDSMARKFYNVSLKGVRDCDLEHWAGKPMQDVAFGNVMKHNTRRGPRWTHTHAVSGTPLLIPQKAGFIPLVRGEFDMSYSPLIRSSFGEGAAYFCAFDFEGRTGEGKCPAATTVLAATMNEFFDDDTQEAESKVYAAGAHAERIAKTLGLDYAKFEGKKVKDAVILVGKDAQLSAADLKKAMGGDTHALVIANDALAGELAGPLGEAAKFVRSTKDFPVKGVSKSMLRFREQVEYKPLKDGDAFALVGDILVDQIDPFQVGDKYRTGSGKAAVLEAKGWGKIPQGEKDLLLRNASQSEDNFMRRYAIVLDQWGVGAGKKVFARSLYTKPAQAFDPIAQYNVLGPWPSMQDDSHYMIDTCPFPVDATKGGTGADEAEAMAIRGDVQPNPRFYPAGLTYLNETPKDLRFLDWRPVAKSRDDGFVDYGTAHPLIAAQAFCTCYCVGFQQRRTDGKITVRFGADWRGKLWVNGKEIAKTYEGHKDEGSIIVEGVQVWGMPPEGTDLKKFDKEHGTFDGKNVFTVKAGCGQSAKSFWLNVTHELKEGEVVRTAVPELDTTDLYESANTGFDPYEYVYW